MIVPSGQATRNRPFRDLSSDRQVYNRLGRWKASIEEACTPLLGRELGRAGNSVTATQLVEQPNYPRRDRPISIGVIDGLQPSFDLLPSRNPSPLLCGMAFRLLKSFSEFVFQFPPPITTKST